LQTALARANQGAGNSLIRIYSTTRPAQPGAHSDSPMCEIVLSKPCGSIDNGQLSLTAADSGMVLTPGTPRWAEWLAADGALLLDGEVTDAAHEGDFVVSGAAAPVGETSPSFMAGAMLALGAVAWT